jgi:arylsulfatase A-like enzyme
MRVDGGVFRSEIEGGGLCRRHQQKRILEMPSNGPNILVIMTDQHSKNVLGCHGNEIVRTPNLDRLAEEGMQFTSAYCPGPLCVPSRMSFMTMRRPGRNQVWDNTHILSSAIPTWAHALGAAGYETSLIGRMHFIGPDQRHGFENRPIGEYHARHPGTPEKGGPRSVHIPMASSGQQRRAVTTAGRGRSTYQWADEQISKFMETKHVGGSPYPSRMIRSGKWKLWRYADDAGLPPALFDLEKDPQERSDLGEDPRYANVRSELMTKLHRDWEPERERMESMDASRSAEVIRRWGAAIEPACEDTLAVPPTELEADVELL